MYVTFIICVFFVPCPFLGYICNLAQYHLNKFCVVKM